MTTRTKRLIKLLETMIKAEHLYNEEQLRDFKSQLRVVKEELAEARLKRNKGFGK